MENRLTQNEIESLDFLVEYYRSYHPIDGRIFMIILFYLNESKVTNKTARKDKLDFLYTNLNKKDFKLLYEYLVFFLDTPMSLSGRAKFSLFPNIGIELIQKRFYAELNNMSIFFISDNNPYFDLFKYFYPFENFDKFENKTSCSEHYDEFYYRIRSQLMLCKTKEAMIEKLQYDTLFYYSIADTFYKDNTFWSYNSLVVNISNIGSQILHVLVNEDNDGIKEDFYKKFSVEKIITKKYLGF